MKTDVITSPAELESLAPEWNELWRRAPGATPFQSPHWILPWWKRFGSHEPFVVTVRESDRLASLAPLYILRDEESSESLGMLLGTGVTDYLDILATGSESAAAAVDAMGAADCLMWDLQQLRPSSLLLASNPPQGWSDNVEDHDPCPVLPIDDPGAGMEKLLSTHARKKLRYFRRCAEREGAVTYETAGRESLDAMLETLFELHAARWQRRGLPGVLADDVIQDFHRDVARRMLEAGALRMYTMRIGERAAAVFYGFAHQGTVYYYLSGYDPSFEKLSIGNLIVAHAVEEAIGEGATTFDFLRGAEEYKYSWGAVDRLNRHRQWFRG